MSFDLRLQQVCTHRVIDEVHFLDQSDRKSVRFIRPPSNTQSVILKMNGFVINPDNGAFGYHFETDEFRVGNVQKLVYNVSLKDITPIIELSYDVTQSNCRRCHGFGIENDIRTDPYGQLQTVVAQQKLIQDLMKWVLTERGSDPFHDFVGTRVITLIGQKGINLQMLKMDVVSEVSEAITKLLKLEAKQATYQRVSASELIDALVSVDFNPRTQDPTIFDLVITVRVASGQVVSSTKTFRIAGLAQQLFGPRLGSPVPSAS